MTQQQGGIVWEEYHDRIAGLVIFGLVQIAIGAAMLLMAPLAVLGTVMSNQAGSPAAQPMSMAVGSAVFYVLAAIPFFVLGVGSILARRWARSLSLALWILWLAYGITGLLGWALVAPSFDDYMRDYMAAVSAGGAGPVPGSIPPGMFTIMAVVASVAMVVFGVLLPLPFVLFYRSRHVKVTCEWRDPKPRWTDRCPLPLLIGAIGTLVYIPMALQYAGTASFMAPGTRIEGAAAVAAGLLLAVATVAAVIGLFRRRRWGWGLAVVVVASQAAAWAWAYVTGDVSYFVDAYEAMPNGEALAKAFEQLFRPFSIWITAWHVLWLAYVLFLWRFLGAPRGPEPQTVPPQAVV